MIHMENYGWWIEFTPAFFGAGKNYPPAFVDGFDQR